MNGPRTYAAIACGKTGDVSDLDSWGYGMPDALWHRRQVQALIDLGRSALDAERIVTQAEQLSLIDGRLDVAQVQALATITDADIADARADWYANRKVPARFKRILDAQVKQGEA